MTCKKCMQKVNFNADNERGEGGGGGRCIWMIKYIDKKKEDTTTEKNVVDDAKRSYVPTTGQPLLAGTSMFTTHPHSQPPPHTRRVRAH